MNDSIIRGDKAGKPASFPNHSQEQQDRRRASRWEEECSYTLIGLRHAQLQKLEAKKQWKSFPLLLLFNMISYKS